MTHRSLTTTRAATAGLLALAAFAAAFAVAGCSRTNERPAPPPPKVTVVLPESRDVEDEEVLNGWTAAVATVQVRSRVRGHIATVDFEDGAIVKAGALLFTLDPRPFQADLDQATSRRKVYEAQLVAERKEQARLEELLGKGGASQKQVEKKQADVKALEAEVGASSAEIERLALDLEYSRIAAPIAGRTSEATLSVGNLVGADGTDPVLTTIVSVDPIYVYFDIPERSLLRYRAGTQASDPSQLAESLSERKMPFSFGLDSDKGFPRKGVLDFADNTVTAGTGTLRMRGSVANPDGFLLPGARVKVRLTSGKPEKALIVPESALVADQDLRYVLVVGPEDKVLRKDARPGRLLGDGMRVLLPAGTSKEGEAAVSPTDRVIVEGQARARIHEPVEPLDRGGQPVASGAASPAPSGATAPAPAGK